ncbi:MAG: hypothetical protein HRU15_11395 [Planctomycetes bacterium]|nr:hypothetical protein [Planctomycetota bacterium]
MRYLICIFVLLFAVSSALNAESKAPVDDTIFTVKAAAQQLYFVNKHDLDFSSFGKIGGHVNRDAVAMKQILEQHGVKIIGNLETQYTFIADPHGPDIPDGKFYIEVAFPVDKKVMIKEGLPYAFVLKEGYRYIAKTQAYPPYHFPWQELREYATMHKLHRTLKERDYHIKLQALGDSENIMECRLQVK